MTDPQTRDRQAAFGKFVTDWEAEHGPIEDADPQTEEAFHRAARALHGLDPDTGRRPGAVDRVPYTRAGRTL